MISIQNNTSPINIGILEVSSQNRAVLSFFIDSIGADIFKEVDLDQAAAFIIDYDFPGAKESWAELYSTTKKPAIILSVKEIEMPGSIWVKKPLTAKALTTAGQKIHALINETTVQPTEELVNIEDFSTSKTLETPDLNHLATEPRPLEKVNVPALATLEAAADSMPTLNESMPTINLEPALTADTTDFSIASSDAADTMVLDIVQPTAVISTDVQDNVTDEVDSLLNDLHSEPQVSEQTPNNISISESHHTADTAIQNSSIEQITEGKAALKPTPTNNLAHSTAISNDLTDTLTLEVQQDIIQPTTKVVETETSELDSLLSELQTEPQVTEEVPRINKNTDALSTNSDPKINIPPVEAPNNEELLNLQEETTLEYTIESSKDQQVLSQNNNEGEPDLFNELIIEPSSEAPQETQANEQNIKIGDSSITDTDKVGSEPSTGSNLAAETTEKVAESYAEASDGDLEAMLDELQQEMGDTTGGTSNSNINAYSTDGSTPKTYQGTRAQERWALLCGDKKLVRNASDIKKTAFILDEHLLSSLLETIKEGKATKQTKRIKYEDLLIIIDYETDTIYSDLSIYSEEYAHLCFDPIKNDQIRIHSLDDSEIRMLHQQIKNDPENVYSTEAFIWTTSLLTSRGRLLKNTNTNKTIGLKSWPNLTRIESFPHTMNIAAVFSKNPGNLLDVSKWLNIPQCYVFAFYNAALSLNMIDFETDIINKNNIMKISFSFGSKKKSENSGLFSRLLNKIKG